MTTLQYRKSTFALALALATTSLFAAPVSKADYAAAKERISAEHKVDKAACNNRSGNAKDICQEQAAGKESIARAELEYAYTGKPADAGKVAIAKADANFENAKERCDDKAGNPKDVCRAEAKAAHVRALADAKVTDQAVDAAKEAREDKRDADYKVAAEKCDGQAGAAKTECIRVAKAHFNLR
ncbi:hypothetical protein [Chitinimonas sp. BJYL2]|uniref:hypothetical protein n=1 Tax=Chitinimonas sp. BJYL2 TaxID=2976696 RepID=UPI0022B2E1BE|nr:hypothetical protein [Chitinimonas sp. BJYL2]